MFVAKKLGRLGLPESKNGVEKHKVRYKPPQPKITYLFI